MKIFLFNIAQFIAMAAPMVGEFFLLQVIVKMPEHRAAPVLIISFAVTALVSYIGSDSINEARKRYVHRKRMEKIGY